MAFFDKKGGLLLNGKFEEISSQMWHGMLIIAILGIIGFTTNTEAYKILDPTMASFVRSLEIVFAEFVQIFAFHDFPSPSSLVGSILVIISVTAKGGETQLKAHLAKCLPNRSDEQNRKFPNKGIVTL